MMSPSPFKFYQRVSHSSDSTHVSDVYSLILIISPEYYSINYTILILARPQWTPTDPTSPPFFDVYVGDFNTPGEKKQRCCSYLQNAQSKMKCQPCLNPYMMAPRNHIHMAQWCFSYLYLKYPLCPQIFERRLSSTMKSFLGRKPFFASVVFITFTLPSS